MLLVLTKLLISKFKYSAVLFCALLAISCNFSGAGETDCCESMELPSYSAEDDVVFHLAYASCYNHKTLIPDWVAWELTSSETDGPNSRENVGFAWDPEVSWPKSRREDYSNSGWDKGHMAPAADMRWSQQAMEECFYLSNICPQDHDLNSGDWANTESLARRIARKYGKVWIVCGPVPGESVKTIGNGKVRIPDSFFKAMLIRKADGTYSAIAFVMANKPGHHDWAYYVRSVDEVETLIGRDLFPRLPDSVEENVESRVVRRDWGI